MTGTTDSISWRPGAANYPAAGERPWMCLTQARAWPPCRLWSGRAVPLGLNTALCQELPHVLDQDIIVEIGAVKHRPGCAGPGRTPPSRQCAGHAPVVRATQQSVQNEQRRRRAPRIRGRRVVLRFPIPCCTPCPVRSISILAVPGQICACRPRNKRTVSPRFVGCRGTFPEP